MDLYAYTQIELLEDIAKKNGIDVPRLRGYRLMAEEEPIPKEEIDDCCKRAEGEVVEGLCRISPPFSLRSWFSEYSWRTDRIAEWYTKKDSDGNYIPRWDRLRGKRRKIAKFEIKKKKRRIKEQFDLWNKFVGRGDVLYIHSRIGAEYENLKNEPWFLGGCTDYYDSSYCDIYAKVNSEDVAEYLKKLEEIEKDEA